MSLNHTEFNFKYSTWARIILSEVPLSSKYVKPKEKSPLNNLHYLTSVLYDVPNPFPLCTPLGG